MWKIFRCKRGEERSFIPGEYLDGGIVLNMKHKSEIEGIIGRLIEDIKKIVTPQIKVIENQEKVIFEGYKKLLEVYKKPIDDLTKGPINNKTHQMRVRIVTHKYNKPVKEIIPAFNVLERGLDPYIYFK